MREPSAAWAMLSGTSQTTSMPSRRKKRSGCTWKLMMMSPGAPPPRARSPWPRMRRREPLSVAGGTVIVTRFSLRTSPAAATGGARLGRDLAAAPALGTRPVDREAALAERDRSAALALGTGGPGRARRAAAAGAGGTGLGHRDGDRDLAAQRRHPERHLHHRFERSRSSAPPGARPGRRWTRRCRPARRSRRSRILRPRHRRAPRPGAARRWTGAAPHRTRPGGASDRTASASRRPRARCAPRRSP